MKVKNYLIVIYFFAFFAFLLYRFLGISPQSFLLDVKNSFNAFYFSKTEVFKSKIQIVFANFNYLQRLHDLQEENRQLRLLTKASQVRLDEMLSLTKITINHPSVKKIRLIGFVDLMDYSKFWADIPDFDPKKLYGLVHDRYAIGVASTLDGKPVAFLNQSELVSYSVQIGQSKILGILKGGADEDAPNLIVDFIPPWEEVLVGDEVITSGLDGIFFKGFQVGQVKQVDVLGSYKRAIIKPAFDMRKVGEFVYAIEL